MDDDNRAIRELLHTWHETTAVGYIGRILPLMVRDGTWRSRTSV